MLVLGPGWAEGQQMNTIEPSPDRARRAATASLLFTLGTIPEGSTSALHRVPGEPDEHRAPPADVVLYDGDARLLTIQRTIKVFP